MVFYFNHTKLLLLWLVPKVHCDLLKVTLRIALDISSNLHIVFAHCCLLWRSDKLDVLLS